MGVGAIRVFSTLFHVSRKSILVNITSVLKTKCGFPQVNEHEVIVHILNNINKKLTDFQQKYKITKGKISLALNILGYHNIMLSV